MKNLRSNKGFTLIELLIVVVIIGILATILISRFTGAKDSAYLAHSNTMADAIKTAALSYSTSRLDGADGDQDQPACQNRSQHCRDSQ